jgi:hypothetical protein
MNGFRVMVNPICGVRIGASVEEPVLVHIADGVKVRIVGACGAHGMVEISDGLNHYAVFESDLLDRSEEAAGDRYLIR